MCRRCPVALGRPRRPALVGSRTAGRLCFRRLSGGRPPTIADLAVTPTTAHARRQGQRTRSAPWSADDMGRRRCRMTRVTIVI